MGDSENIGMRGLLVAHIYLFFRFSYGSIDYPCALVHWFSMHGNKPHLNTHLWIVELEFAH